MSLDPLNILLLAVALVVFWRLKSVLGTRTGMEKPPIDPFGKRQGDSQNGAEAGGTVVRFPQNVPAPDERPAEQKAPAEPVWKGFAEPDTDLATSLQKLADTDPSFNPRGFVDGAKMAYEMIIDGFAKGDKPSLKNLLSREVFDGFARAIDEREAAGHRVDSRFVGIDKASIVSAGLSGKRATVTLEFVSELITATYDRDGEVIDGDPKEIREVTDVWTFERDVTSRDPNWKLVATQAPG